VLRYRVLIYLWSVHDFNPPDPSSPHSPPESDYGDSGHDGDPDRHHFSRGSGPWIQGFWCSRGTVNGEPITAANGNWEGTSRGAGVNSQAHNMQLHDNSYIKAAIKRGDTAQVAQGKQLDPPPKRAKPVQISAKWTSTRLPSIQTVLEDSLPLIL
jgi:hypothetical protein